MARFDKKTLAVVGSGIVAVLAIAFSVNGCVASQAKEDISAKKLQDANFQIQSLSRAVDSLKAAVKDEKTKVADKDNYIAFYRNRIDADSDSINVLNDSLITVNGRLADCERQKQECCGKQKKQQPAKTYKKPQARAAASVAAPVEPKKPVVAKKREDDIHAHAGNKGTNNVVADNNVTIQANGNSGTMYINNGVINNYGPQEKKTEKQGEPLRRGCMTVTCVTHNKSR